MKAKKGTQNCSLEHLLYPVELMDNPFYCNKEASIWVMGRLDNQARPFFIQACSDIYELVENAKIFPNIEDILNLHGIEFEVEYSHTGNVRFYANYIITDSRYAYTMKGTNDKIQPMLRVQHSYNGKTKYRIVFGYFRLICSNGATISVKEMDEFNLCITGKHTTAILGSLEQLDSLMGVFAVEAKTITAALTEKYELLASRKVTNLEARLTDILKENKIAAIKNSKFDTLQDIKGRIMAEVDSPTLGYNGVVNDWLVYNGINQYLNDDTLNISSPEARMEIDSKVFEYMLEHPE